MKASSRGTGKPWLFNAQDDLANAAKGVTVDDLRIAELLGKTPPDPVMDLIELVAAVHLVDRAERRPAGSKPGDSWSRRLHVVVGVRETHLWSEPGIHSLLVGLLRWLTDDEWMIEFVPRVAPNRHAERVQFLFASPMDGDVVALFSGGLDSLAGLAADIDAGVNPIALSIESNTKIAKSQRDVLEHLNNALNTSISRVPIGLHLRSVPGTEQSQRARGFGFLALAGALAVLTGRDLIHVYENGIGAINLPYTSAQTGAHGTRAMHPATLNMATVLLSAALDSTLQIVNRSQYKTKAEMCAALPSSLYSAVAATETCDTAFTYRGSGALSCGRCTSCLLRRQALAASKLTTLDPASNYRLDAFSESEAPYQLRAMLSQASRIHRAIGARTSCTWAALIGEFPDLVGIAHSLNVGPGEKAEVGLIDLLQRYVKEWAEVPSPLVASYLGHDYVAA